MSEGEETRRMLEGGRNEGKGRKERRERYGIEKRS